MGRHDVSNPASATPASLFPNDFSSSNAREKPAREKALTETERQVDELEHQLAQFRQDYDFMKFRLDQTNPAGNLDHSYQSRRVQIKLACWPHSALDLHGPHGWDSDPSSLSQILCLRRVNTRDNCCAWAISPHNDIECYLGVSETEPRKVEIQRGRRSDDQHWFIGLNSQKTGYRIESQRFRQSQLEMENPRENMNGKPVLHGPKNEKCEGQIWHIVVLD